MEENKPEVTVLSVELSQAVQADALVNSGMELAYTGITKICEGVKLMHDGKLYRQLGFKNFEEYCKSKGFSKSYGKGLLRIAEMLRQEKNGQPVVHFENLGVAKLLQLATLQPEQRAEIIQTVNIEDISKRDLEKEIKKMKEKEKQSESRIAELESENQASAKALDEITADKNRIASALQEKQDRIIELERQNQELENRPVEVYHSEEDKQEIERLTVQNEALEEQRAELEQRIFAYESQEQLQPEKTPEYQNLMKAMHNNSHELSEDYKKLQDESWKRENQLKREHKIALRQKDEEIQALQAQLAEKSAEPKESQESKQFRIQLVTISNSLTQLFYFLCDHPQAKFLEQSANLFKDAENSLNDIRKQVQG
ncbi:MAG: hypothetical protein K2H82_04505 [Oscillospiraceae bacterium]|nr:hypothetical protein [Oscillospiraceae bacterium]